MKQHIADIVKLTQSMLASCEIGDWDDLIIMEEKRSRYISSLFADRLTAEKNIDAIGIMRSQLRVLDKSIMDICTAESSDCQKQLRNLNNRRKAIASYQICDAGN